MLLLLMFVLRRAGLLVKGADGEPQPYWLVRNSLVEDVGCARLL